MQGMEAPRAYVMKDEEEDGGVQGEREREGGRAGGGEKRWW